MLSEKFNTNPLGGAQAQNRVNCAEISVTPRDNDVTSRWHVPSELHSGTDARIIEEVDVFSMNWL